MNEEQKKALHKIAEICCGREQCSSDIKKKIVQKWDLSYTEADEVILELIKQRFIDDRRYATFFAQDKYRFNNWGKNKISYMLKQKGISENIISDALNKINEEEYTNKLIEILSHKKRTVTAKNPYDLKNKLIRYAFNKGFEYELIVDAIEKTEKDEEL